MKIAHILTLEVVLKVQHSGGESVSGVFEKGCFSSIWRRRQRRTEGEEKTQVDRGGVYVKGVGFDWTMMELRGS